MRKYSDNVQSEAVASEDFLAGVGQSVLSSGPWIEWTIAAVVVKSGANRPYLAGFIFMDCRRRKTDYER